MARKQKKSKQAPKVGSPPQGWACPKCGRVWAPYVAECHHCCPLEHYDSVRWEK